MDKNTTEDYIAQLFIEAERQELRLARHLWEFREWESENSGKSPTPEMIDSQLELREPFEAQLRALYLATLCLLDLHRLSAYVSQFYLMFGETFDSQRASKFDEDREGPGSLRSTFLRDLAGFLLPVGVNLRDPYRSQAGVSYLENVLDNTATLLHQLNIQPQSEAKVYRPVRKFLGLMFDSSRNPPAGRFSKSLKYYKPDILVPELSAAIEYKFIKTKDELSAALAGIADDVKGYTGDLEYKLFYAVFYLSRPVVGRKQFLAAWEEKKFPREWIPVYVVGNGS